MDTEAFEHADRAFSRRLERSEGLACAAIVCSRGRLNPGSGSTWQDFGGACAMFDGDGSPMTQAFGFGLYDDANAESLDAIEAFFGARQAKPVLEISPLAGMATTSILLERGYRIIEMSSVLWRPSAGGVRNTHASTLSTRIADLSETDIWSETAAQGWGGDAPELAQFIGDLGHAIVPADKMISFFAERDGAPIATASLFLGDGIALLAGASTTASARRQGAQSALLAARLAYATAHDCPLAMMATEPGSASQRNGERQGFRVAYTRMKWARAG